MGRESIVVVGGVAEVVSALEGLAPELANPETAEAVLDHVRARPEQAVLVLVPLSHAGLDGLALAEAIHEAARHVPIVLLAAHGAWEASAPRVRACGIVDYAPLPIHAASLRAKTALWLELAAHRVRALDEDAALRGFARSAVHDLRAPLRSIASHANWLCDPEATVDERAKSRASVIDGIERMSHALGQLGSLAGLPAPTVAREAVDLDAVVRRVCDSDLRGLIADARASVDIAALGTVVGDAAQLRSVFANVIENAVKFRRPDVAPQIRITCTRDGTVARIDVADNGMGFDMAQHDDVFAPFRRLVTVRAGGAGLGMTIAKQIVDRHGGSISASSELGRGATFHIELRVPNRGERGVAARPPRILFVDDSDDDQLLFRHELEDDFEITCCDSADAAYAHLPGDFIAIVTDYHLPGKSGLWLLEQARQQCPANVLRILRSGILDAACEDAVRDGVVDHALAKMLDASDLRALLHAHAARPGSTDESA